MPLGVSVAPAIMQNGEQLQVVTLANHGRTPALNARLTLLDAGGARILPAFYSDNYVALLPGETRRIEIRAALTAPPAQRLTVSGWNVQPAIIGLHNAAGPPKGASIARLPSPAPVRTTGRGRAQATAAHQ